MQPSIILYISLAVIFFGIIINGLLFFLQQEKTKKNLLKIQQSEDGLKDKREDLRELKERVDTYTKQKIKEAQIQGDKIIKAKEKEGEALIEVQRKKALSLQTKNQTAQSELVQTKEIIKKMENAMEAMDRKIQGYGNDYIISEIQLIDQLADDYAISSLGEQLKEYRKQFRAMVRADEALTGGNKQVRQFVLSAFNNKVDEILSRVKHDNYGTLCREMIDEYDIFNQQMSIIDSSLSISYDYLQIRLEELKYASTIRQLKIKEREEQRIIQEQIREENRARKEYERAVKEAAAEESKINAVIQKVRKEMQAAAAEQQAQYEEQLADLSIKLKEAEEKNQRALSMAQQTKAGNVYVISNIGSFGDNIVKIGNTRRLDPMDRVRELGDASVPFRFDVHAIIYSNNAPALENELHKAFNHARVNKVNYRKEFFRVTPSQVREQLKGMGIEAQFTLSCEAEEYRETLKIESMAQDEQDVLLDSLLKYNPDESIFDDDDEE